MTRKTLYLLLIGILFNIAPLLAQQDAKIHWDKPFKQDFSIKYPGKVEASERFSLAVGRHGNVQVVENGKLLRPAYGAFQQDGKLVPDHSYLPMKDKQILAIDHHEGQLVYLSDKAILSNAWAGDLYLPHGLMKAYAFAGGKHMDFVTVGTGQIHYLRKDLKTSPLPIKQQIIDLRYDKKRNQFLLLHKDGILSFTPEGNKVSELFTGNGLTSFDLDPTKDLAVVGTHKGFFTLDLSDFKSSSLNAKLP